MQYAGHSHGNLTIETPIQRLYMRRIVLRGADLTLLLSLLDSLPVFLPMLTEGLSWSADIDQGYLSHEIV